MTKEEAIEILNNVAWLGTNEDRLKNEEAVAMAIQALELAPTIDAVEVVRCKDCRWYEIAELKADGTEDKRFKPSLCILQNRTMDEDYYCADGERKEDE